MPLTVAAVMVALPTALPVTTPPETVATSVLEEVQVTVLSVASEGETVAVRVSVAPTPRPRVLLFRVMPVTACSRTKLLRRSGTAIRATMAATEERPMVVSGAKVP